MLTCRPAYEHVPPHPPIASSSQQTRACHPTSPQLINAAITKYRIVGVPTAAGNINVTVEYKGVILSDGTLQFTFGAGTYKPGVSYRFYAYAINSAGVGPASLPYGPFATPT